MSHTPPSTPRYTANAYQHYGQTYIVIIDNNAPAGGPRRPCTFPLDPPRGDYFFPSFQQVPAAGHDRLIEHGWAPDIDAMLDVTRWNGWLRHPYGWTMPVIPVEQDPTDESTMLRREPAGSPS